MNNFIKRFFLFSFLLFPIFNLFGEFNSKNFNPDNSEQLFKAVEELNIEEVESVLQEAKNYFKDNEEGFVEYINSCDEDGDTVLHALAELAFSAEGFNFDKDDDGNDILKKLNKTDTEKLNKIIKILKILLSNGAEKWVINGSSIVPYNYLCFIDPDEKFLTFYKGSKEFQEIKILLDISFCALLRDFKKDFCTIL